MGEAITLAESHANVIQMSLPTYPIGQPALSQNPGPESRVQLIARIASLPDRLSKVVAALPNSELDRPIRPDAWTIRQLTHHITDSHLNAFIRFRWCLTEENPVIKGYDEMAWAYSLPDAKSAPVALSLNLLEALHARWVVMMQHIASAQWNRTIQNPESGSWTLLQLLIYYSWHGDHHLAQIEQQLVLGK